MELVQWIVARGDGALFTAFAPAWAERMPLAGDLARAFALTTTSTTTSSLRRRGAPLTSRWLAQPLAMAGPDAVDDDRERTHTLPSAPGSVSLSLRIGAEGSLPLLPPSSSSLSWGALFGEYARCVADLCEAASLPVMGLAPHVEQRGLVVTFGGLFGHPAGGLADALLLVRVACEISAQARGFLLEDAALDVAGRAAPIPVDGRLLARLVAPEKP